MNQNASLWPDNKNYICSTDTICVYMVREIHSVELDHVAR